MLADQALRLRGVKPHWAALSMALLPARAENWFMDPNVVIPWLIGLTTVMVAWCIIGWAIYGGGRGEGRSGGLFWALYMFLAIPWVVSAAGVAVLAMFFWVLMAITGGFNN